MVLHLFCFDIEAKKVAEFTGLNRGTVNNIFGKLREHIAEICESESPFENGEIELDESYFGARRVRGKRGRGAQGKTALSTNGTQLPTTAHKKTHPELDTFFVLKRKNF
jgi:hypothetical protein